MPGQALVLEREDDFQHGRHGGRRLEMSQVRLHRADEERALRIAALPHGIGERGNLDRITQRRAGAMGFDVVDLAAAHAGSRHRLRDHGALGASVGDGEPAARAVLVHRRAGDDGENAIAIALGVAEPLEDQDAAAFAAHVPVGAIVERAAVPGR